MFPSGRPGIDFNPTYYPTTVCPGIVTGISAIIWFNQYTTRRNCWLNTNQPPYWPSVIPIVACTGLQFFLILITLCSSDVPVSLSESQYKRA
ncbi:hypothetical protein AVEN_206497-1, partial [Araneus ventricosus]